MAAYIWTHLEAICMPLVMKTALRTDIVCPSNVFRQLQSLTAQSFRVVSAEAVRTHWVEGGEGREGGRKGGREGEEKEEKEREGREKTKRVKKMSKSEEQDPQTWSTGENWTLQMPLL